MDKNKARKYFARKKPYGAVFFIIISFITFLMGISLKDGYIWIVMGILFFATGIFIIILYNKNYSDLAIDNYCKELFQDYLKESEIILEKDGVQPLYSYSSYNYCFENIFSMRRAVKCSDGKHRSSILKIDLLYISKENCCHFCKQISLISDEVLSKKKIFHLEDIQMVSFEEYNTYVTVVIAVAGNEKILINCNSIKEAEKLSNELKIKQTSD